jgi:hypothetical protein
MDKIPASQNNVVTASPPLHPIEEPDHRDRGREQDGEQDDIKQIEHRFSPLLLAPAASRPPQDGGQFASSRCIGPIKNS